MVFVATLKGRGLSPKETIARRMNWDYPEGVKVIDEYWPQNAHASVISIFEADSIEQIMPITVEWGDAFEIVVSPAITPEDGQALAKQMTG